MNSCFQAMLHKGLMNKNISQKNKQSHYHLLESTARAKKDKLATELLKRKIAVYEMLQADKEVLKNQVDFTNGGSK